MKLYVLDGGRLYLDESLLVAGIHNATLQNQNPSAQWVATPVISFLVETAAGYVLYDTGNHPHTNTNASAVYFTWQPEQLMPESLTRLGLAPEDIKYVVQSHLHSDHVGYLHLFKNAEVFVSDEEFTQAMRLYGLGRFGGAIKRADFESFLGAQLNWRLIPSDVCEVEICEGVTVVNLGPGHSFGMLGMLARLPHSGNFLMCSDAINREENLGPPPRLPTLLYDSLGYIKSVEFIRRYARERDARILYGHDMRQFAGLKKSTEGFYD
ncbi:MAG: N-acyl homoserine lactonase family protein [Peptococcaceae bacterium]|jgi:glyoxylase-like metal-dependent hydrolase (beta-lactamase superfamily II)|nr:N-acyl homoserine lactonase family protein [Peptococcaceae bacterium]